MNDRFIFRAWDNEEKKMFFEVQNAHDNIGRLTVPVDSFGELLRNEEKRFIVMQCTGLKDKNGKLIFEGDIFKEVYENDEGTYSVFHTFVKWDSKECCFFLAEKGQDEIEIYGFYDSVTELEIIGNIYENPELLNKNHNKILKLNN